MNIDQLTSAFKYQLEKGLTTLNFMKVAGTNITVFKHDLEKEPFTDLLTELNGWSFEPPSADNPDRIPKFIPNHLNI